MDYNCSCLLEDHTYWVEMYYGGKITLQDGLKTTIDCSSTRRFGLSPRFKRHQPVLLELQITLFKDPQLSLLIPLEYLQHKDI